MRNQGNGYQFLENDFFELCKTRKITKINMLLYIYLRGLYCRFQKAEFFWSDKTSREQLGVSLNTLKTARNYLQERGMVKFISGVGKTATKYTMIGNVLLPDVRVSKIDSLKSRVSKFDSQTIKNRHSSRQKLTVSTDKNNQRLNNRLSIFEGLTEQQRQELRTKGLLK